MFVKKLKAFGIKSSKRTSSIILMIENVFVCFNIGGQNPDNLKNMLRPFLP
jgi:hypothetical protein